MSDEEVKKPQFELRDDGEVHFNKKGQSTLLAKYDHERGRLTFESFAIDQKYRSQIIRAVTEDAMTGEQTGRRIKGYAIVGRPKDVLKRNEPPQPRKSPVLGDKTPEFVRWMFKWRPQAAYARFGVLLDSNAEPKTAHCRRIERGLILPDTGKNLEMGDGKDVLGVTEIDKEEGILALRATCMTFLTTEIVKGEGQEEHFEDDEDLEASPDDAEAEDGAPAAKPKGGKGRANKAKDDEDDDDEKAVDPDADEA